MCVPGVEGSEKQCAPPRGIISGTALTQVLFSVIIHHTSLFHKKQDNGIISIGPIPTGCLDIPLWNVQAPGRDRAN